MQQDYQCTFDDVTKKVAELELYEDPNNREGAVETLRQWVKDQPHITAPTDTRFLLGFLRAKKFSQLEARTLLDNYLTRRTKHAAWFQDLNPGDPKLQAVIDDGIILPLPGRDKENRKIFIIRPGSIDTSFKRYKAADVFRACACLLDYIYWDELTQVHGTVVIKDFTGYTLKHHGATNVEDRKNFLQTWQKHYPGRIKGIHVYNLGPVGEIIMSIAKMSMPEKMQQRMHLHGRVLEGVYDHVSMELLPEEYLPDDYKGKHAGSVRSIIDQLKKDITTLPPCELVRHYSQSKYGVDELKRPKTSDPQQSFRKLNVD